MVITVIFEQRYEHHVGMLEVIPIGGNQYIHSSGFGSIQLSSMSYIAYKRNSPIRLLCLTHADLRRPRFLLHNFQIVFHHHLHKIIKRYLPLPPELPLGIVGVSSRRLPHTTIYLPMIRSCTDSTIALRPLLYGRTRLAAFWVILIYELRSGFSTILSRQRGKICAIEAFAHLVTIRKGGKYAILLSNPLCDSLE
jgi:hypothetical protein